MGLNDAIKRTVDNVKDTVDETQHRSSAEAERERRDVAGDAMPADKKVGSVVNEKIHETQAGIDRVKRDVRNNT